LICHIFSPQDLTVPPLSQAASGLPVIDENNDVSSLLSRFGSFGVSAQYQELVRQEAAIHASRRWPLLAELVGGAEEGDRS
jgi:hypothetical protein